jgi:hypothetical protein
VCNRPDHAINSPRAWHLAPLAALAVSHPIAEVLVRGPEFFVAHHFTRVRFLSLGFVLFGILPAAFWLIASVATRLHAGAGRWLTRALFAVLTASIALQAFNHTPLDERYVVPAAAAAGLLGAVLYAGFAAFRFFVAMLAPAPLVIALVFFISSPVTRMMGASASISAASGALTTTPVVMIVFDQLPLVSLLDEDGAVDRRRYPNFAAFADEATWYRNTTAAAVTTNWALPALLSGRYPEPDRLPAFFDHPDNLFSLFANTHEFHVREPISSLCPPGWCQPPDDLDAVGMPPWLAVSSDLAVVYGHVVLPRALAARLPPITHDWRGFGLDLWQGRWLARRQDDRRRNALKWIGEIRNTDRPVLHLLHMLLPHEPFIYLPNGQIGSTTPDLPGIGPYETWTDEERLVAINYQRHLLQVQMVDRLLGSILQRLRQVGVYDRALIAVVADHGAAFRPERPFRTAVPSTLAEIAAIPFFLKEPRQSGGRIVNAPLQAIDVLPTMAHALGVSIPWTIDGRAAQRPPPSQQKRRIYLHRALRHMTFSGGELEAALQLARDRKREWVDPDPSRLDWLRDPARTLIGRPVDGLAVDGEPRMSVTLDHRGVFADVDPGGPYVPVYVTGMARTLDDSAAVYAPLAIAVNGIVRATTAPARHAIGGRDGFWAALIAPDAYRRGANEMDAFEIVSANPPRLRPVAFSGRSRLPPNLLDKGIQLTRGISEHGFYDPEWNGTMFFRWTSGEACIVIPIDPERPPGELELTVVTGAKPDQEIEVRVNDCVLFEGPAGRERWTKTLQLSPCGDLGDSMTVSFSSETFMPESGDRRRLGVAVGPLRLR